MTVTSKRLLKWSASWLRKCYTVIQYQEELWASFWIRVHQLTAFRCFVLIIYSQLAERAGIPPGVLNVVTSSRQKTPAVGKVICEHPLVSKISFTGSTAVGKVGICMDDWMRQGKNRCLLVYVSRGRLYPLQAKFYLFEIHGLETGALV